MNRLPIRSMIKNALVLYFILRIFTMRQFLKGCALVAFVLLSGCAEQKNISPLPTISEDAKSELSRPVNCRTARSDIRVLEDEKASVGKQILSGVRSVMPIAAVAGILMGDYQDRVEVATGQYNSDIEAKIAQIKTKCRIRD